MKQEYAIKEFTVICDAAGIVEQIKSYNNRDNLLEIGNHFSKLLDKDSQIIFKNFLFAVKKEGYALGYVLSINIDNITQPVCVNAFYKNHKFHISVMIGCQGTLKTLNHIRLLNNKHISYKKTTEPPREELLEYIEVLENWVMKDPLTDIFNQRYFNSVVYKEALKAYEAGSRLTLIAIDFDNLKEFNDVFGYRKGDELLLTFVSITRKLLREGKDTLFRLGGDEFLILCSDRNQMESYRLMERLNDELQAYSAYASISYGIAEIPPEKMGEEFNINLFLEEADKKIIQDKKNKKKYELQYKI